MSLNDEIEMNINNEDRKSIFTSTKEEINPIVVQLQNLGYNKVYSRRVFYYLHPEDLEEALNYMAIENGIIQHRYIQGRYISNNICYICGEERKKHLNELNNENIKNNHFNNNRIYINKINKRQIENNDFNNEMKVNELNEFQDDLGNFSCNNKNKETIFPKNIFKFKYNKNKIDNKPFIINNTLDNLIPEEEEKECEICNEIFIVNENNKVEKCGHSFCPGCWYDFLSVKIKENKLPSIKCLDYNCKEKLTDEFIINLLNSDTKLVRKYKKYKLELEIINDPNKKLCPYPNCNSYLEIIDIRDKDVTCYNLHSFCFECLKKPHGKLPCGENIDKNLIEYAKNNFVKKCPKCSIIIEKNKGCNHIICSKCGYQWCWLCNNEYNENHFNEGKCRGFQFFQPENDYEIKLMKEGKINLNELPKGQRQHNLDDFEQDIVIRPEHIIRNINNQDLMGREFNNNNYPLNNQLEYGEKTLLILLYIFLGNNLFFLKYSHYYYIAGKFLFFLLVMIHFLHLIIFFFQLIFLNILTLIILVFSGAIKHFWKPMTFSQQYLVIILYLFLGNFFLVYYIWKNLLKKIHMSKNKCVKFMIFFFCFIISIIILFPKGILINIIFLFITFLIKKDFYLLLFQLDDILESL